jgi:hypothetical protein
MISFSNPPLLGTKLLCALRFSPHYSSHSIPATDSLLAIFKGSLSRTYERKLSAATEAHRPLDPDPHQSLLAPPHLETMPGTGSAGPFSSQMCASLQQCSSTIPCLPEVADHPKHKRLNIEAVRRQLPPEIRASRSPAARHPHKQIALSAFCILC